MVVGIVVLFFYLGYKNFNLDLKYLNPQSTPSCKVNCWNSTPQPGSIPGWVKYENTDVGYSFEYPENWFYIDKPYTIDGTDLITSEGLYSVSKDKLEKDKIDKAFTMGYYYFSLNYSSMRLENVMGSTYEIVSSKINKFGNTEVITNTYCLKAGTFYKGVSLKANQVCSVVSAIDMGEDGYLSVEKLVDPIIQSSDDIKIYKKILSTVKFTK